MLKRFRGAALAAVIVATGLGIGAPRDSHASFQVAAPFSGTILTCVGLCQNPLVGLKAGDLLGGRLVFQVTSLGQTTLTDTADILSAQFGAAKASTPTVPAIGFSTEVPTSLLFFDLAGNDGVNLGLDALSPKTGTFNASGLLVLGAPIPDMFFNFDMSAASPFDVSITQQTSTGPVAVLTGTGNFGDVEVISTPIPAAAWLLGSGLLALGAARVRRRR